MKNILGLGIGLVASAVVASVGIIVKNKKHHDLKSRLMTVIEEESSVDLTYEEKERIVSSIISSPSIKGESHDIIVEAFRDWLACARSGSSISA